MTDRGPYGQDPDPTEVFPPLPDDPAPTPPGLPPIGADRDPEPTRVMPTPLGGGEVPTTAMPVSGGPYGPGPPYGGPPGGGGDEPPFEPEPDPWYRQPGPVAALIAGVAALVVALIALLVWAGGDDDDVADETLPPVVSSTTTPPTSAPPPTTAPSTTVPETTTSTTTTTTSTTLPETTSTTSTTLPPTTTTTAPPTTTTTTTPPAPPPITVPPGATAWQIISRQEDFSSLEEALECTGLRDVVEGPGPITVLAPSNAAFDELRLSLGGDLCADPDAVEPILQLHIIDTDMTADQIRDEDEIVTLGGNVPVNDDGTIGTGSAAIVVADVRASNGLLQAVDAIVQP